MGNGVSMGNGGSMGNGVGVAPPKSTPRPGLLDTSMRLTMLRQDSALKPLVRRSLSGNQAVVT